MKIKITIPTERIHNPIISESIVETGILINIMVANIDSTYGELIADVSDLRFDKIKKAMESRGAVVLSAGPFTGMKKSVSIAEPVFRSAR